MQKQGRREEAERDKTGGQKTRNSLENVMALRREKRE